MRTRYLHTICFSLFYFTTFSQVDIAKDFINQGDFIVSEGSIVSSDYFFINTSTGNFENRGTLYYYNDFKNDNLFYPGGTKSSKVYFNSNKDNAPQLIEGLKLSEFYDIEFNNSFLNHGFNLSNEITVKGNSSFVSGVVNVLDNEGMITFLPQSTTTQVSDVSHVDGYVEKKGSDSFIFPIGHKGYYRPAIISALSSEKDLYVGKYQYETPDFFTNRLAKSGVITNLDTKEYWEIKRSDFNSGDIMLTLSWDERTTPKELLVNPEKELHIVRWDAKQQLWVDEGGVVDLEKKEITTPTSVKGYGFFTLATVNTDLILDGDIVIYNLVSPDGDGKNDYFIIDNINRFPNNTVEIYNRWGVKVYDTKSYDSAGNVFRGYSDGRVTINKGEKLPTGTYFYIVSYEYKDASGSRMIKKSGYLHLESNK
ncbi:gliding motility-associated C-terminal domain-containing protein [Myroides odoratimimus]|uniref:gliding motility-associated C-terminal domain-containing protein n=1 Tax=Myroides odoratimimus TaxID=76832 RepID=UPI002DBB6F67|nr:gliding motility-associated C-terminal domain-containing protein [Myroides odoratimimus]MEC4054583.1 gliding motility-associated C-terminal domain-containing protein [Myroides odoratimimus]